MEKREEWISEHEKRKTEITKSEQQRENILKKNVNRGTETGGTIRKDLTFGSLACQRER